MRTLPVLLIVLVAGTVTVARHPQAPSQSQTPPQVQNRPLTGDLKDAAERTRKATEVFNELAAVPEKGIPADLLGRAEAIIVIPSLMKGGFVIGAQHGKGIVSARRAGNSGAGSSTSGDGASGWSGPAFVKMTGGSIGWQIGLQSIDLVLLVMNKKGLDELLEDRFTIGGSLSVAAGPLGRSGTAATNITAETGILGYSRAQGLFAGATLEGAGIRNDKDENEAVWGRDPHLRDILLGGTKPAVTFPAELVQWQATLARLAARR